MNRLYEKSKIWFAVVWIIVYVVVGSLADGASVALGVEKSLTLVFHVLLTAVALIWLRQNGLLREYGLCRPGVSAGRFLYYIPLIILVSVNLWYGVRMNMGGLETVFYVGSMLCVGFLEELIFRGFLFKAMCHGSVKAAVIVSSLTFGIGHMVNLINGSGAQLVENLCQVCGAVAFGFLFVVIFHRGGSLLPCIAAHSVLNALSAFVGEGSQIVTAAILTVGAAAYAIVLLKRLPCSDISMTA